MTTTTTEERPADQAEAEPDVTVADATAGTATPDPQAALATSGTGNAAMVVRDDQTAWTPAQRAMLAAMGVDDDVTDAELQLFLYECQRRRLDPFAKQIYLIGRMDRQAGRKVYRSQVSIDGFRLIARRAADKAGIDYGYAEHGTIWYEQGGQEHKIWLTSMPPAGAKVVVVRNGMHYDAEARFEAYAATFPSGDLMNQWRTMPDVMIAKCAEALALRKAFPEDLGGLYTVEEMEQADNETSYRFPGTSTTGRQNAEQGRGQAAARNRGGGNQRNRGQGQQGQQGQQNQRPKPKGDPTTEENQAWIDAAMIAAPEIPDLETWQQAWDDGAERAQAGAITPKDSTDLANLLKARKAELEKAALQATQLDPDDPWYDAIAQISSAADAPPVRTDITKQFGKSKEHQARYRQLMAAVNGRVQIILDAQQEQVRTGADGVVHGTVEGEAAA